MYVAFGSLLSQIRLSSVTFVRRDVRRLTLSAIFLCRFVPQPSFDHCAKFCRDRPMGTHTPGRYLCHVRVSHLLMSFLYNIRAAQ